MAKKPNQPFKEFITVPNDTGLLTMEKSLTNKDIYQLSMEDVEGFTKQNDVLVSISATLTEYNIQKNPHLLLQTTDRREIFKQISERIDSLDPLTRDVYKILFAHWIDNKDDNGDAYIEIEYIHFGYRGLSGKNSESTLTDEIYQKYISAIDILQHTKVKFLINEETNIAYKKFQKHNYGGIESFLIHVNHYTTYATNQDKVRGVSYNMKVFYDTFVKKLNKNYPTSLLQLSTRSDVIKNMGNYLCYLHASCKDNNIEISRINFYTLMGESGFEIKNSRYQEYIQRFINHIRKTEKLLINAHILQSIKVPIDINSKNYKYQQVIVTWDYSNQIRFEEIV
jgi:galactitol-specific phosphotransferase system IIB component